ncbi:YeeE/YedE thiosulfate transporter family protein [Cupriavidus consociatus]|uniref:YeeE/YedE thiosulfate transporter family protein n=1 Tax=Cupriavidus consociatus TaxID=2821357 RepID=UPI001AEA68FB|nr:MULTISPECIES: YeeE/YedE thiosulfate transporter family protein [unclassified Cupriavidus]MBP0621015.1 YeeE/YedE family protein [Cupriavidus sp. LEh25]MDK2657684.1 YeeE/YedE thiosulfate transporter family protein [Cupriavidus sp. LEh21]
MTRMLLSLSFAGALLCAAVMGFAIQRGATCAVAAVSEITSSRSCKRLLAMAEASLYVCGGLLIAQRLRLLPAMPSGYPVDVLTVLGGALLGLGAYINGACVFGAVARLGSGQWAYAATPIGYYVGCVGLLALWPQAERQVLAATSPVWRAAPLLTVLFLLFVGWRLLCPWLRARRKGARARLEQRWHERVAARIWSPHHATTMIGLAFLLLLLLAGAWSYTEVLAELARGGADMLPARALLSLGLLAGAILGGKSGGRLDGPGISFAQCLRCFTGGAIMGWGSLLIPGGNDGLLLVGMPLLWPYAWIAFGTMCVTIAFAQWLQRQLGQSVATPGALQEPDQSCCTGDSLKEKA